MAIIKGVPGIEAVVLVNGTKAQEYEGVMSKHKVGRFIESVDDAEFAVRILVNGEYEFQKDGDNGLGIQVLVDGKYMCSRTWHKNRPVDYILLKGSKQQKESGGTTLSPFKFTEIKTVDGKGEDLEYERELVAQQIEDTKSTGEITVLFNRVKINNKPKPGLLTNEGKADTIPHSELLLKANVGDERQLTHGTGFGAEVDDEKTARKFGCEPIDPPGKSIAKFLFIYRAKHVIDDYKPKRAPISEDLPLTARKNSGMFMEQDPIQSQEPVEIPKPIKDEPNNADDDAMGDVYGATPQRQMQPPAKTATTSPADDMAAFHDLVMSFDISKLTKEQKEFLAQKLHDDVSITAQNLQSPRPISQPTASIAPVAAQDSVKIKQERDEATGSRRPMNITIPRRTNYRERQTGNGGVEIDLTTPVQETFIKPDPGVIVQVANQVENTVMVEQGSSHAALDNVSGDSATSTVTENAVAVEFPNLGAIRAAIRASIEKNEKASQGSMSTVDGVATPRTPDAPVQEPAFERAEEREAISVDAMQVEQMEQVEKPATPKAFSSPVEVDVIASIEAADAAFSVVEAVRHRKDSILSDASNDLNTDSQRARSGHPTITTVHSAGRYGPIILSPTLQPDELNGLAIREATEGIPVKTIDIDTTTGYDIRQHSIEEDSHSPSRQLNFDLDEGFGYSPIKGLENTIIGTPASAAKISEKPTGGFEAALTTEDAQTTSDAIQTAEAIASPLTSEKPVMSFEEAIARAKAKNTKKPTATTQRATTPLAAIPADVEVPATPTAAPEDIAPPASEVHTGDHGFIDIESIVAVPETPVKHTTPHGLKKNDVVTTPITSKGTPRTLDSLLSASRKDMEGLDLNVDVDTPRKRLNFNKDRTPSSKFGEDKVGAPVTGNAGGSEKKTTPIKRKRDDEENEVVQVETPTKKMKYLKLGSNKDEPISFDSDDELPEAEFEQVKVAKVSHSQVAEEW